MGETDEAAKLAWDGRKAAVRHGCQAAIDALERDHHLASGQSVTHATDILWTLLSVRTWEHFIIDCGWSQQLYIKEIKAIARQILVKSDADG